jgi:DNA polymerase-1
MQRGSLGGNASSESIRIIPLKDLLFSEEDFADGVLLILSISIINSEQTQWALTVENLYIIDASGFIFRAFHALPPLKRPDGVPVGAVLGFCNMVIRFLTEHDVTYLAVVFDSKRQNFRHEIYPLYKANRDETPPDLIPQFQLVRDACQAFNLPVLEKEGFEADDVIATLAQKAKTQGFHVRIVSSDKDLMQLVDDQVLLIDPLKFTLLDHEAVMAKFGVPPEKVVDVQALAGDSSDNVPGVPGIGIKTAAELITAFGSLEGLLCQTDKIPQPKRRQSLETHAEDARISYKLVTLERQVPLDISFDTLKKHAPEPLALQSFIQTHHLKSLASRVDKLFTQTSIDAETTPLSPPPSAALPPQQYELILTEERLQHWLTQARDQGYIAFDTETTALSPMRARLVGFSLALAPGKACYIPLAHVTKPQAGLLFDGPEPTSMTSSQIPLERALDLLRPLLENPAVLIIGHNLKYDMTILSHYGLTIASYADTMVLSYDLFNSQHGHGMDELAQRYLNYKTITYDEVTTVGKTKISFQEVPLDKALAYAAEDADVTLRLYHLFWPQCQAHQAFQIYLDIDQPMVQVLHRMETGGILVDQEALSQAGQQFQDQMTRLEAEIHTLAGRPFNLGSPKQLGEILFEEMGLSGGKKGKSGAYGTSADVLEDLAALGHAFPQKILEWRQYAKLQNTYVTGLKDQCNPNTGRVHTSFGLTSTLTGRLSSSDPNLQNIPVKTAEGRLIRHAFIAPPDHVLLSLDYSQIELRLLAHMAQIPALIQAFKNQEDIHTRTAAEVFGVPLDQVDNAHRRKAKAINFGIIYGMSAFGLAKQLKIGRSEAQAYIDTYFQRYPEILQFMEKQKTFGVQHGYAQTLFGRRCYLTNSPTQGPGRGYMERQAINAPLQGTASDIIKKAMIQVVPLLQGHQLRSRLLLQVHDELIFEVHHEDKEKTLDLVKATMETSVSLSVPLVVDGGWGTTWDEAHQ